VGRDEPCDSSQPTGLLPGEEARFPVTDYASDGRAVSGCEKVAQAKD